jgi:hypothetical protein
MSKKNRSQIVVFAPRNSVAEQIISSWMMSIEGAKLSESSLVESLKSPTSKLVVLTGEFPGNGEVDLLSDRELIKNKSVYHIGEAPKDSEAFLQSGVRSYIGFKKCFSFVRAKDRNKPSSVENSFQEFSLTPIRCLLEGKSLAEAIELTRSHAEQLCAGLEPFSIVRAITRRNSDSLFGVGDLDWRLESNADIIIVTSPINNLVKNRVEVFDITPVIVDWVQADPTRMSQLSPDRFEDLVAERLTKMNFEVVKVGTTYSRDGGIDIIASPRAAPFPFFLAVQVKHHKGDTPVGDSVVRELRGSIAGTALDIGLVVTNTRFTASAEWAARERGRIIRLRGFDALRNWLRNEFVDDLLMPELPDEVELAPGVIVQLPKVLRSD